MMHKTIHEIRRVPEGILEAQASFEKFIESEGDFVLPKDILFTGCGSSHFLSQLLAMATTHLGGRGMATPCSEFLYASDYYPFGDPELLVAISRSGETTEVLKVVDSTDVPVMGIAAYEGSLLQKADHPLLVPTQEESVVMTHSFPAFLFAFQQLLNHSYGKPLYDANELANLSRRVLESESYLKGIVDEFNFRNVIFLGSGILYPVALEAALKMKEMAIFWSEAYQTFEVRHGFKSVADDGTLVVLLVDEPFDWHFKLTDEFRGQGARVLTVGKGPTGGDYFVEIPGPAVPQSTALYLTVIQLLSYYKAVARGVNPDSPRFLSKVVKW